MKPLSYLACPYSHAEADVRHRRFELVNKVAGMLTERGHVVFSPISHSHPIALAHELPTHWEFWESIDRAYLSVCREVFVLTIDGWRESRGVTAEIAIATEFGLPIVFIDEHARICAEVRETKESEV